MPFRKPQLCRRRPVSQMTTTNHVILKSLVQSQQGSRNYRCSVWERSAVLVAKCTSKTQILADNFHQRFMHRIQVSMWLGRVAFNMRFKWGNIVFVLLGSLRSGGHISSIVPPSRRVVSIYHDILPFYTPLRCSYMPFR